jgi:group I intron endonuclease
MHIYTITNLINGKVYVGQTVQKNPKMRWYAHLADARSGKKSHLYDSIRKYGVDNFQWIIVQEAANLEELNILETIWEQRLKSEGKILYNNRGTGNNKLHSEQSIFKMKESQVKAHARRKELGIDTWTRRDGGAMKGKKLTDNQKKQRSIVMSEVNKRTSGGRTWKIINGKRTRVNKEASV